MTTPPSPIAATLTRLLADPQAVPADLSRQIILLASANRFDDGAAIAAIQQGLAILGTKDHARAVLSAIEAANVALTPSQTHAAIQTSWLLLMSSRLLGDGTPIFPLVEQSFNSVLDPAFKEIIGRKVLELSAASGLGLDGATKSTLSAVQAFALSSGNPSLADEAGQHLAELDAGVKGPSIL